MIFLTIMKIHFSQIRNLLKITWNFIQHYTITYTDWYINHVIVITIGIISNKCIPQTLIIFSFQTNTLSFQVYWFKLYCLYHVYWIWVHYLTPSCTILTFLQIQTISCLFIDSIQKHAILNKKFVLCSVFYSTIIYTIDYITNHFVYHVSLSIREFAFNIISLIFTSLYK